MKLSSAITHRVSWNVHHRQRDEMVELFTSTFREPLIIENCRTVRQRIRKRPFLPGKILQLEDSPTDLFSTLISDEHIPELLELLHQTSHSHKLGARTKGMVFHQQVHTWEKAPSQQGSTNQSGNLSKAPESYLQDLAVIHLILSNPEYAEQLAAILLNLGAGVPVISLGEGTGMRDRLGLLRITVPAAKEIVRLLVPRIDAPAIAQQLIDKGKLNRPGQGFLYITPVTQGILDTRLRIGEQDQAASLDQIVSALDTLYRGTRWRQRYVQSEYDQLKQRKPTHATEVTCYCESDQGAGFIEQAIAKGAPGATISNVQVITHDQDTLSQRPQEKCVITVPNNLVEPVVEGLIDAQEILDQPVHSIQTLESFWVYSYRKG
jgi:nitrogen regulatory protein PII